MLTNIYFFCLHINLLIGVSGLELTFHNDNCNRYVMDDLLAISKISLVFGASGISGISLIDTLLEDPAKWTKIVAVSRRPPPQKSETISHVSVDLLNSSSDEIAGSLVKGGAGDATHAFFFSYIAKDDEDDLIKTNYKLFSNVSNTPVNYQNVI